VHTLKTNCDACANRYHVFSHCFECSNVEGLILFTPEEQEHVCQCCGNTWTGSECMFAIPDPVVSPPIEPGTPCIDCYTMPPATLPECEACNGTWTALPIFDGAILVEMYYECSLPTTTAAPTLSPTPQPTSAPTAPPTASPMELNDGNCTDGSYPLACNANNGTLNGLFYDDQHDYYVPCNATGPVHTRKFNCDACANRYHTFSHCFECSNLEGLLLVPEEEQAEICRCCGSTWTGTECLFAIPDPVVIPHVEPGTPCVDCLTHPPVTLPDCELCNGTWVAIPIFDGAILIEMYYECILGSTPAPTTSPTSASPTAPPTGSPSDIVTTASPTASPSTSSSPTSLPTASPAGKNCGSMIHCSAPPGFTVEPHF